MGEPATPAEQAALDTFRELLPEDGLTRAWVNLTFLDLDGRAGEVDVLLLTKRGFFVVELKGWHGTVGGNQQSWHQILPSGQVRHYDNPLKLTISKAKRLKSLLQQVHPNAPVPYLGALVVMHGQGSTIELDDLGRTHVLALDGYQLAGGLPTLGSFLTSQADNPHHMVDRPTATAARKACEKAGFVATPRQRRIGQYVLDDGDPVAVGQDWQDFVVTHPALDLKRRLRLFDVPPQSSPDERARIEAGARRELRLTEPLHHDGVDRPLDYLVTDSGPALLFDVWPDAQPLDQYLAARGDSLDFDTRLQLIRQIGEVLRYTHNRHLAHRALAPSRVWVRDELGRGPRIRIRDWYTGQREASTRTKVTALSAGLTDVRGAVDEKDWVYLAREALHGAEELPSIPLDVYGLGALAHLILTGEPPATTLAELQARFGRDEGLDPSAVVPEIPDQYADVVRRATAFAEPERTASVEAFLTQLDEAAQDLRPDERNPQPVQDPLDARAGSVIADRFDVVERRGEGSTGTALLAVDYDSDDTRPIILKVARNDAAAQRLTVEAEVLAQLDHPRVVRLIGGPIPLDGRHALLLSDAGKETLATRIASEGRSTIEQLEGYGRDLLEAVAHLDERGVFHRDIKPANLAISPDPGTRKPRLTLFDLSLAREPLDNTTSGTPGYLDPYLALSGRRQYDRAAELWSVAATLFEMATGNPLWWPEGSHGPLSVDEAPVVMATSFEDAVADALTGFFRRALAPDARDRFSDLGEMAQAWAAVFADLDTAGDGADGDDAAAAAATLTTPLNHAGLSARALSGVLRLDVLTVGDLLGIPPSSINAVRGLGEHYRKEIQRRIREWRARLSETTAVEVTPGRGVEGVVRVVLAVPSSSRADEAPLRALVGLDTPPGPQAPWPTVAEAAERSGVSQDALTSALNRAVKRWAKLDVVRDVRDDLVAILASEGRVMTLAEVALALAGRLGSQLEGAARRDHAVALVRAAVEVEEREDEPRVTIRRPSAGATPLVALTETAQPDDALTTAGSHLSADALTELAVALGARADDLVVDGVVPAARARAELRALLPTGAERSADVTDERLVRLAAATSVTAAVSGFGELYPRSLPVADAIDHALRGRPGRVISEMWVRRRVFSRFPELEATVPSHPELDPLVLAALPGMAWNGTQYAARDSTGVSQSVTGYGATVTGVSTSEVDRTLRTSLRQHAPLTLAVAPHRYQQAITALVATYDVALLDVSRLVVDATRALAEEQEVPWEVVLDADAAQRGSYDWEQLTSLVREALAPRWAEAMADPRPLLVVNAGPLARYGMREDLSQLLDIGSPRPATRWLLVARDGSTAVPHLEGQPVPLGPSGVLDLPALLDFASPTDTGAST
ncbi:BREX system serine/threonine kinase PglW [Nocardioides sp. Y6]|uniref:non-specific serine/threonine protein kinase n=1 Tax=Nocardioides malaquae TaxID=2773426 RepID=A0ABR9RUE5_9ACTN|nr:BREX system serine/threonine kinase PglW [Nocardioides malaquae]MBE7325176.1 BREX system serine/threonine kinase PglW [Nocardioides malaquae]